VHHRAEILALVEQMQRERVFTTVEFADGHAIVSSVLEVRRDANALVFDVARDADQNLRLFASQVLHFVTELDHVQVAFETGAAAPVMLVDGPAALVDLPPTVVRLQRRAWFRAALPAQPPIRCTVLQANGRTMAGQAIDLSAGGAALVVADASTEPATPGAHHELILSLPDIGRLELEATLLTVTTTTGPDDGMAKTRMGFRFDGVPAKTANQIQRYVQRLEVDQLRLLKQRE
jgi:c-di-GMP-binding flagellar brake protein YcgR